MQGWGNCWVSFTFQWIEYSSPKSDFSKYRYKVRFEDVTSKKTKIHFMTDGSLLREAMSDRLMLKYSCIILDEAHERTINTDILFGIVKGAQKIRSSQNKIPLKV